MGTWEFLKENVDKMLSKGVIDPSITLWGSPVVLAQKKEGTYHLCVDYRRLNNITVRY